jgi:hypothetical protein
VDTAAVAKQAMDAGAQGPRIGEAIRAARLAAIVQGLKAQI